MQTKQQIQHLLASAGVTPNKRLGQHFLIDLNLMRLLVGSAGICHSDIVLEVGCGTGSLTEALVETAGLVIAVEYDKTLAKIAAGQLKDADNLRIINADVLENKNTLCPTVIEQLEDAKSGFSGRLMLIANLPYNTAAAVMLNLITGPVTVDSMFVTVQKEVAQRMVAAPGTGDYGTLSIFMAAAGDVRIIRKLAASVFWPRPQVESAMVSFTRDKQKIRPIDSMDLLGDVISLFMGHRRKMLKACIKFATGELSRVHNWDDIFTRALVEPHQRPQDLSARQYVSIANLCNERIESAG